LVNAGTSNEDIISDREDALTTNPLSILAPDPSIVENSCLIELHTTIVDLASKRHLVWVEVVKARCACDFIRMITQDICDRFGSKLNVRIRSKV
jgi:hypothetical protein